MNVYLPNLPAFFLALAVILNVSKWIYYLLKIWAFISVGKKAVEELAEKEDRLVRNSRAIENAPRMSTPLLNRSQSVDNIVEGMPTTYEYADIEQEDMDGNSSGNGSNVSDPANLMANEMKKMKRRLKIVNYSLVVITAIFVSIFLYYTIDGCITSDLANLAPINNVISFMYCFLGITFFAVGLTMIILLRNHFPEFYKNYRCLLWLATILLTLPLFIRTLKDYEYYNN